MNSLTQHEINSIDLKSTVLDSLQLAVTPRNTFESQKKTNDLICDDWPHDSMIESYNLSVNLNGPNGTPNAILSSESNWGFLRGLETFSQLVYRLDYSKSLYSINETIISDAPRFKHRGFMMDTARHFIPLKTLKKNLDAMSYNKLNVFHWHIVDDQSFPYVSEKFPQLSKTSAFKPNMVYTQQDVADILEYARLRGIRVIPEFDTPGHSYAMRIIPRLLTDCYDENDKLNGDVGPMDPIKPETYVFMNKFISELAGVFPDQYFHAGGDEVDYSCWASNPIINSWMNKNNITTYQGLEGHYIRRILNILRYYKKVPMVWQEIFDNGAQLKKGTIVHVWKYINDPLGYTAEMTRVTQAGHYAILSSCWYMNYISYGQDWIKFYNCDPQDFVGSKEQYDLVLGGEACIWTEYVDETNVISRAWPRSSATAERLWSPRDVRDIGDFSERVEQLRCRMKSRGIMAEPIVGPGYC